MKIALHKAPDGTIPRPSGIVTVRISPESGLLAPAGYSGAIFEIFRDGHVPALQADDLGPELPGGPMERIEPEEDIF